MESQVERSYKSPNKRQKIESNDSWDDALEDELTRCIFHDTGILELVNITTRWRTGTGGEGLTNVPATQSAEQW